jgi:hypothetical protein
MNDDDLIPVFIPSLSSILLRYERDKGSALTESEVIEIRDKCTVVMLRRAAAAQMDERRGYVDIDPERCWQQWQELRTQFLEP